MAKRLLDYDKLTRTAVYHDYDHETKQTIITEVQDVEHYLERNKKLANDSDYKKKESSTTGITLHLCLTVSWLRSCKSIMSIGATMMICLK